MGDVVIRPGRKEDLPRTLELIKELATYERAPDEVINTVPEMERDGFGADSIFGLYVAERGGIIVGISLFYWRYSTWKGKRLYLEDIVVTETERGHGVGKALFDRTMKHAVDSGCSGMKWQVLTWNEPAINFYRKYGAKLDNEWTDCSLELDQLIELTAKLT